MRVEALLFGESTGRVVLTTADAPALLRLAGSRGVPACEIGQTGGDRLRIAAGTGQDEADADNLNTVADIASLVASKLS